MFVLAMECSKSSVPVGVRAFDNQISVAMAEGSHPFPFRTRKLSLLPPMVLPAQVGGRVGRCRGFIQSQSALRAGYGSYTKAE